MSRTETGMVLTAAALLFASLIVMALPASALAQGLQGRTRIVVRGGYDTQRDAGGLGAAVRIPIGGAFELIPSGDYFFVSFGDAWQGQSRRRHQVR